VSFSSTIIEQLFIWKCNLYTYSLCLYFYRWKNMGWFINYVTQYLELRLQLCILSSQNLDTPPFYYRDVIYGRPLLARKLLIICWWNWLQAYGELYFTDGAIYKVSISLSLHDPKTLTICFLSYKVCHWFRLTKWDDYYWVNFDHFWIEQYFWRQLGQYWKLARA